MVGRHVGDWEFFSTEIFSERAMKLKENKSGRAKFCAFLCHCLVENTQLSPSFTEKSGEKECLCYYYGIEHMFGACKECREHKTHAAGRRIHGPTVITRLLKLEQRNFIFIPTRRLLSFLEINYSFEIIYFLHGSHARCNLYGGTIGTEVM